MPSLQRDSRPSLGALTTNSYFELQRQFIIHNRRESEKILILCHITSALMLLTPFAVVTHRFLCVFCEAFTKANINILPKSSDISKSSVLLLTFTFNVLCIPPRFPCSQKAPKTQIRLSPEVLFSSSISALCLLLLCNKLPSQPMSRSVATKPVLFVCLLMSLLIPCLAHRRRLINIRDQR